MSREGVVEESVANRARPGARTELFWAVERSERYRVCAELATLAGRVVIVARSVADASLIANELSRHGVPAASLENRDFGADYIRAQIVTDETLIKCDRSAAVCVVHFDPAGGPRRYRRRIDLLATKRALVVTFVVPERLDGVGILLASLHRPAELGPVEMAVARRALIIATNVLDDDESAPHPSAATRLTLLKERLRIGVRMRQGLAGVGRRIRHLMPGSSQSRSESTVHRDQRAS